MVIAIGLSNVFHKPVAHPIQSTNFKCIYLNQNTIKLNTVKSSI